MLTIAIIAGGVALILLGVRTLRKGLDRIFGPRLGVWIQHLARTRIRAFLTGIGVSVLAPSSTTMSVLAVQTVQAGQLNARQGLAVLLGADIGLTVMILVIAMRMEQAAPLFILVGVVLDQFTHRIRSRGVGQVLLAIGFILMGILTIHERSGLQPTDDMADLIGIAQRYPPFMAILAAMLALAVQSSTATIALLMALSATESMQIPLTMTVPVVIGANVGIGVTTLIVGWRQSESRRLAMGNLIAKAVIAIGALAALPWIAGGLVRLPFTDTGRIAAAHVGFNVVVATVWMPLVPYLHALTELMFPPSPLSRRRRFGPRHIQDAPPDAVALAMGLSTREIMHVAEIVRAMLADLWSALQTDNEALCNEIRQRDDHVDQLDTLIKQYLTRLAAQGLDQDDAAEQMRQLRYLNELESIGDVIDKNLCELVLKKIRTRSSFSSEGWTELNDFYDKVTENLLIADTAFTTQDRDLAQTLMRHKERINAYDRELRDRHFERLNAGQIASHETSAIHLDLLSQLKRINSCVSHVAYSILQPVASER